MPRDCARDDDPRTSVMTQPIHDRLLEIREEIRVLEGRKSVLDEARNTVRQLEHLHDSLTEKLAKEQADVDKLQGLSLTGLFASVLGNKVEKLSKEREELVGAKLRFDECAEALGEARSHARALEDQVAPLAGLETDYQEILGEKATLIAGKGGDRAARLLDFSEELADLRAEQRELEEAIKAGRRASSRLRAVQESLRSAGNWGTFDLLGGGLIATAVKHSKIDDAKRLAHHAQRDLRVFQNELSDAGQRLHVSLDIGGVATFADYFFDGLIADWFVQSKISKSSQACDRAIKTVERALRACVLRKAECMETIVTKAEQRQAFLEER